MAVNPAEAPAAEAALYGAAALFTLMAWVALSGLHWGWRQTFGAVATWFADHLDAIAIKIPFAGHVRLFGAVAALIRAADRDVSHGLAAAALSCEHAFVYTINHAAGSLRQLARWLNELGAFEVALVNKLVHVAFPRVERRANTYAHRIAGVVAREQARVFDYRLRLARAIGVAAEAEAIHAYRTAAHALDFSESWARVLKRDRSEFNRLRQELEKLLYGAGAVALVATALGKLGLRWLRCSNVKKAGRALCGLHPEWLLLLLAEGLEAMVVLDLCRYALAMQRLARVIVPQLGDVLLVANAVCLGGGASLPSAHDSPDVATRITLPSAHD